MSARRDLQQAAARVLDLQVPETLNDLRKALTADLLETTSPTPVKVVATEGYRAVYDLSRTCLDLSPVTIKLVVDGSKAGLIIDGEVVDLVDVLGRVGYKIEEKKP